MEPPKGTYVFRHKSWEPVVEIESNGLIYAMPVACGHFDRVFRFAISESEFEILKSDAERRYFLYAVLHSRYQTKQKAAEVAGTLQNDSHFQRILFGSVEDVVNLLNLRDAESNGAVSNLAGTLLGREQQTMRDGSWFSDQEKRTRGR